MQSHREGVRQDKNEDKTRAKKKKEKLFGKKHVFSFGHEMYVVTWKISQKKRPKLKKGKPLPED